MDSLLTLKKVFIKYCLGLCSEDEVKRLLSSDMQNDFLNWAKDHRVLPAAYPLVYGERNECNLEEYETNDTQDPEMIYRRYLKRREKIIETLEGLSNINSKSDTPQLLYLKGISIEKYYPKNIHRFTNDVDLVVCEPQSLWTYIKKSLDEGFDQNFLPKIRFDGNEKLIGLFKMAKEDTSASSAVFVKEFNIGGFTITDITYIPEDILKRDYEKFSINNNAQIDTLSVTNHLLVLFGELVTRRVHFIRDAIDFLLLLKHSTVKQLNELKKFISQYALEHEVARLVTYINKISVGYSFLKGFQIDFLNEYTKGYFEQTEFTRCYKSHIIPFLNHTKNITEVYEDVLYFRKRERLGEKVDLDDEGCLSLKRLMKLNAKYPSPMSQLQAGHHVYLVFIEGTEKGELKFIKRDKYDFVRTPVGTYWLTQEALESEEIYDEVFELSSIGVKQNT
jgi:Uncharacterised nucleotidyltransferase